MSQNVWSMGSIDSPPKKCYTSGASVGLVSGALQIADTTKCTENYEPNFDIGMLTKRAQVCDNLFGVGKTAFADANFAECHANVGRLVGFGVSALSASAHAEYGLNNSVGVSASVVRANGNVGPVNVGIGLNFDCNANLGVNGVGATFLGTGFNIGPNMSIKTPFIDLSVNLI